MEVLKMNEIIKHKEWDCELVFGAYGNGNIAIQLMDIEDGQPVAVATVNPDDMIVPMPWVCIKTWAENEGIVETLIKNGVVNEPIEDKIQMGYVTAYIMELTDMAMEQLKKEMEG
jgi:hypothetical protein